MAKNKPKGSISDNFENLKMQMMKKRELAEKIIEKSEDSPKVTPLNERQDEATIYNKDVNTSTENDMYPKYEPKETPYITETNESRTDNIDESKSMIESLIDVNKSSDINETFDVNKASQEELYKSSRYTSAKETVVADININKIVIKKVEKFEAPKRITYYLRPETIAKIDKFSKLTGMGKSEFVQKILDEVLNNLEVEN
ncbi:hypothetical protein SAMN02745163_02000 [Clostridium cavendishii DSM 21758]|uniref:Uncharacterized protein n=1 Tax=Clostridium cavendishii DSM 21758 TaxID=1121302 RepID=A0A1M6JDS1_9CLOT|nr:hypothetical protein [Clostridium cavendishii]SHJ44879.1 hypothetical protein SAMN02745163_02000 [Clostridium cavendishii DSM 21758]